MIRIRDALTSDAEALQELYGEIRREATWLPADAGRESDFARDSQGERVWVAVSGRGRVEGLISVNEAESFVHHLYVRPASRRQGVAGALLAAVLPGVSRPWRLKCVRANGEAMAFYARRGWVEIGGGEGPEGAYALLEHSWFARPNLLPDSDAAGGAARTE